MSTKRLQEKFGKSGLKGGLAEEWLYEKLNKVYDRVIDLREDWKSQTDGIDFGIKKDRECPTNKIPSLDTRALGAVTPPRKSYSSNHTIAPAYNKGGYQVISQSNIKDIGK